ncbi:CBS domain-containing protein [Texcoconibacillus texcoconensis]|uniref:Acetoin utilization protein AcuB n=1 Tax=Texcoconibacillus texcoconensis TaxID=1095777 RepID=A0A840QN52_9BACI|nr:CBS domain-containing protein [Texcoconibacillus texcoconensis]MBB5172770.1 acetoin utilization protein AcuB [Texcoconibacillus texcoconensis]
MIVRQLMKTDFNKVHQSTTIAEAIALLEAARVRHLIVTDEKENMVGIVSDRDLRDASPSTLNNKESAYSMEKPLSSVMTHDVITAHPDDLVEEIATLMTQQRIGCVPVQLHDEIIGVVRDKDILRMLVKLMGADQPTSRIEVQVPNVSGMLAEVSAIIQNFEINVQSVFMYPAKRNDKKMLVFRLQTMDPRKVIDEVRDHGYEIHWPIGPEMNRYE